MLPRFELKTLFAIILFFTAGHAGAKPPYQVLCYTLQNTMAPSNSVNDTGQGTAINWTSDVPWTDITLVLDAFYQPETNDTFTNEGAKGSALISAAHAQGERCVVSLGGAQQDGAYPTLCSSAANINAFAKAVTALMSSNNYDGADIDWETPNAASVADATSMMVTLYNAIKALPASSVDGQPRTLSFTTTNYITCIYDMTTLANYSDWCFFMGYDWYENPTYLVNGPLGGMPDDASAPSPCSSSDFTDDDKGWITAITNGVIWSYPASKMILGCPLYTDDYSAGTEIDTLSILHLGTAGTYNTGYAEQVYKAPDNDTVYVDTAQSYCDKINWMHSAGLMGIGMWDMGQGLPYTDTDMAPIWSAIGGNSACLTFVGSTSTPTHTQTMTPTTFNTATHTMTPTSTLAANTATQTATLTLTHTPTITSTLTQTHTATAVPPTATSTLTLTHTNTPPAVTSTFTSTMTVTETETGSSTPSATSTASSTHTNTPPAATSTFTSTMTVSATQTSSSTPSVTSTGTLPPTQTYTNTLTSTATVLATSTQTATFTVPASTATMTPNSTLTMTASPTMTATMPAPASTPTPSSTFIFTATSTVTATNTATLTPTPRANSPTVTLTFSSTSTATWAYTASPSFTWSPIPAFTNCPGVSAWSGNFVSYRVGQEVGYNGELYECIQSHTSQPNWTPPAVPALWKDMGPCGTTPTSVAAQGTPVVYPNPVTSGTASIQLPAANLSNVKLQIFTVAFREVQTQNLAQVPGNEMKVALVDKSGQVLADGLYYFVIQSGSSRWIEKVLVLR